VISRIYIDNYKCFSNFEYRPGAMQLLLGPNGTGKTAVFDILDALRIFIASGTTSLLAFPPSTVTAWDQRSDQTFELGLNGRGGEYVYRLIVKHDRTARRNRIDYEDLCFDGRALYQFQQGEAHLFRNDGTAGPVFPFDSSRSAIPTIPERNDNELLSWFRWRLNRIFVFSPDPVRMTAHSEEEQSHPDRWLHQLASWIRHLHLESPELSQRLAESLRQDVLDRLVGYRFLDQGEGARLLKFEFGSPGSDYGPISKSFLLGLDQLSTGQRALVALYMMLHAAVEQDRTLCIDEPDNYVALREIQPWLVQLSDKVQDTGGQCLLISHHPELINYLASDCGMRFFREGGGPVRVQPFEWSEDEPLRPAEVVARGWEND
jgi:predicted ATPase